MSIRLRHFQKSVYFTDRRHKVRNKGLELGVEINFLGLEPSDVLKEFLNLARNRQVCILERVVSARCKLFIITLRIFIIVRRRRLCLGRSNLLLLLLLLHVWLKLLLLLHRMNVVFFFRIYFLAIVHAHSKIVVLVVDGLSLDIRFYGRWLSHRSVGCSLSLVIVAGFGLVFFFGVESFVG